MSREGAQVQVEEKNVELKKKTKLVNLCACNFESLKNLSWTRIHISLVPAPRCFPVICRCEITFRGPVLEPRGLSGDKEGFSFIYFSL